MRSLYVAVACVALLGLFGCESSTKPDAIDHQVVADVNILGGSAQGNPTLEDFIAGSASFENNDALIGPPGMAFLSFVKLRNNTVYAYYVDLPGVSLAVSYDGGNSFSTLQKHVLRPGDYPWTSTMASFPSVVRHNGRWFMAFEASGHGNPGSIGIARSRDGLTWQIDARPILTKARGWESINVGTPLLRRFDGKWLLYYHGYGSGTGGRPDVQIGFATGRRLDRLKRNPSNPVVRTSHAPGVDSGTVGKRDIVRVGNRWAMVYEVSTDDPGTGFKDANWSSRIAWSHHPYGPWTKIPTPVVPQTSGQFGFDGPEFIRTPDGRTHVYYRYGPNRTRRATLVWNGTNTGQPNSPPPQSNDPPPADNPPPPTETKWTFEAESLFHQIGRADGPGWSANTGADASGFLVYGPYTRAIAPGSRIARFRMKIDNNSADNLVVCTIDVYDADTGQILAQKNVRRSHFPKANRWRRFKLPFQAPTGHRLETRAYWHDRAYINVDRIVVR